MTPGNINLTVVLHKQKQDPDLFRQIAERLSRMSEDFKKLADLWDKLPEEEVKKEEDNEDESTVSSDPLP